MGDDITWIWQYLSTCLFHKLNSIHLFIKNCLGTLSPRAWWFAMKCMWYINSVTFVQNYAALIITHVQKWDHISPISMSCIGCLENNALTTKFYYMFTKLCMAWALSIWLTSLHHISRERTWGLLVNITLTHHVHPLKPMAIEHSCRRHQDCGMNYQKTSGVLNPLKFSRPTSKLISAGLLLMDHLISGSVALCCFMLVWLSERFAQRIEQS